MPLCSTCANNALGYCPVYARLIPTDKENIEHDCPSWRMNRIIDPVEIVSGLIGTHPEHAEQWWCVRDMIEGELSPPAGRRIAAIHVLWTAPYLDLQTRTAISKAFIPF